MNTTFPSMQDRGAPQRVGRNDPCPCGSGKKYKQCCGRPQPAAQVLYLHPPKQGVDYDPRRPDMGRPYGLIPVGVAALVNVLRENGIQVAGLNHPLEKSLNPDFDLRQWLGRHAGARVVMIDLHWYEHAYGAISLAEACKAALPNAWTVLGGLTASGYAREILESHPQVDCIIRGDAEQPLLELVQRILLGAEPDAHGLDLSAIPNLTYRRDGAVVENERTYCATTADLDRLSGPGARSELHRGFRPHGTWARSLEAMADMWDQARVGHERNWWPVPSGW